MDTTKICPMCAETIQLEAKVCRFCGVRFEIKNVGYCSNCHEMREAGEDGRCAVCKSELLDSHIESALIPPAATPTPPPPLPPRKKSRAWAWILGISLLLAGACIIGGIIMSTKQTAAGQPPFAPRRSLHPRASRPPWSRRARPHPRR